MKMDSSVLKKISSFEMLGLPFSSTLDCGSYIISLIKTVFKKIGALIHFIKIYFLWKKVTLYLYKSTIWSDWNPVMSSLVQECWSFTCYLS